MTEPLAVDIEQAAALLGVGQSLLRRLVDRHEVPHLRLGDRLLFSVEALREWSTAQALDALMTKDAQPPRPRLSVQEEARGPRRRPRAV